jgi:uncharacterized protein
MDNANQIRHLIETAQVEALDYILEKNPALANEGLPCSEQNPAKAHPLHRLCDAVFENRITDLQAVEVAKIFLKHGAKINGVDVKKNQDSPLVAASSLRADEVAIFYIENGADIHHAGCHGGTAIHWAAWCGRDKLVKKLIESNADLNRRCTDFTATPLGWAVHGYKFTEGENRSNQFDCARRLVEAGADRNIPNCDGARPIDLLDPHDEHFIQLLQS